MNNREIAAVLFNISTMLAEQHGNPYRIRAYRQAARNILRAQHSVVDRARNGEPLGIPFLGPRLTTTITRLALEGTCDVYEELLSELPSAERTLMHVPGIGPKLAQRIVRDLRAVEADEVIEQAAAVGLQRVWGIGPKRSRTIVNSLSQHREAKEAAEPRIIRDGNVIYVQESFWNAERKNAA